VQAGQPAGIKTGWPAIGLSSAEAARLQSTVSFILVFCLWRASLLIQEEGPLPGVDP
jgi:hypothetical protein